ncbi:MAG: DNA primase, partial [Candidatus Micrarchaeota archaeon]|nr:DNA primase [Candidatus Micrarchaeota archaeon]
LQKNGKIGRIEIEVNQSSNKTFGKLFLPASLDRVETCILAAAVEAVDRVGPYEAIFSVDKVEDTRSEKRRKILNRAKELVKKLMTSGGMPDSKEISELVQADVRASEITEYGPEKLAAGPDIATSEEVIVVEGRADVLNLLRNDITNAIAVGGATNNIPRSIVDLMNQKDSTLFLDGDRGGDMIARSILNVAEVDYIARAPDGKEVEDLTRKEIIKSIRTRIPTDQYKGLGGVNQQRREQQQRRQEPQPQQRPQQTYQQQPVQKPEMPTQQPKATPQVDEDDSSDLPRIDQTSYEPASTLGRMPAQEAASNPVLQAQVLSQISVGLDELSGTLRSRLYDNAGNVIKEVPIRELLSEVDYSKGAYAIVLDGVITQRLVELALQKGIKAIYGQKANPLTRKFHDIVLYTKEQGTIS